MRAKTLVQLNMALGLGMWGTAILQVRNNWNALQQIYLLILFGVGLLVPLALYTTHTAPITNGYLARLPQIVLYFQPLVTLATGLAILDKDRFGFLSVAWFMQSSLLALIGLARWLPNRWTTIEEIAINMGFIYTATSGIWFLMSRTSGSFMGFSGIIVPLTAAHFVFIGMGALINIGLLGRHIRQHTPQYLRWYRVGALGAISSPALVAIGITLTEFLNKVSPIEVLAVILLASSFVWSAGLYLLFIRPTIAHPITRNLLTAANLTLFLTMTMALGYSVGRFTDWWVLTIADMVMWHAWFNVLGFIGLSMAAWSIASLESN